MIEKSNYPNIENHLIFYILTSQLFLLRRNGGGIELLTTRSYKLQKGRGGWEIEDGGRQERWRKKKRIPVKWSLVEFRIRERERERIKAIIYVYLRVSYSTPSRDRIVSVGVWLCTLSHGQTCEGVCVCARAQLQPHGQQPRKRSLTIPFRPRENGSPNCSSSSSEISTKLCTMRWTLRLSRRGLPFYRGLVSG